MGGTPATQGSVTSLPRSICQGIGLSVGLGGDTANVEGSAFCMELTDGSLQALTHIHVVVMTFEVTRSQPSRTSMGDVGLMYWTLLYHYHQITEGITFGKIMFHSFSRASEMCSIYEKVPFSFNFLLIYITFVVPILHNLLKRCFTEIQL